MTRTLGLLALVLLAGCGRTGPPRPPGPASEIIYPRPYPAPPAGTEVVPARGTVVPSMPLPVPTR